MSFAPPVSLKPQIIATRGILNSNLTSVGYLRTDARLRCYLPPVPVSQIQIATPGFWIQGGAATAEVNFGYDQNVECAIEQISPNNFTTAYTNGAKVGNIPDGAAIVLSTPAAGYVFPASGSFFLRYSRGVQSRSQSMGYNYPATSNGLASGDSGIITPTPTSQIQAVGAIASNTGSSSFGAVTPSMIIGVPAYPTPAVMIIGDSISSGIGDTSISALGSSGYVARGLENIGGSVAVPYCNIAVSGVQLNKMQQNISPRIWAYAPYCTHIIIQAGTNDLNGGAYTLSQMQALITQISTDVKSIVGPYGKRPQLWICKVLPCTTSTDSWATAANQTPVTNFGTGGTRDTYNAWLSTVVGSLIDGVIDPNLYAEDQTNHGKWITNGTANYPTTDGTHPSTAVAILAAQAVAAAATTFTP